MKRVSCIEYDGYIEIPSVLLGELDLKKGDSLIIGMDNGSIVLKKK